MDAKTFERVLGNPQQLAREIGVTVDMIYVWRQRKTVPAHWVVPVSNATGVEPYEIKPNIFPPPKPKARARA